MLKLFKFPSTATVEEIEETVNAFIADKWEDNEEWEVAGPVTSVSDTNRIVVTLILRRKR